MSESFRPVLELWGEHSHRYVSTGALLKVLEAIADHTTEPKHAGRYFEKCEYGEMENVWILFGQRFLNFLETREFSGAWLADHIGDSEESLSDYSSLANNMKTLVPLWRGFLDTDHSLRFYIDG